MSELRTKRTQRAPPRRIILGVDPGVAIVGYAAVDQQQGKLSLLACDVIRTPASLPLSDRLQHIFAQVQALIERLHPSEAAVESLFFSTNRQTAIPVAHARGVILLALNQAHLPIAEYTPNQVKLAVTGYGNAKKGQVGAMVRALLNLPAIPRPDDAADAAAIAICHAHMTAWHVPGANNATPLHRKGKP